MSIKYLYKKKDKLEQEINDLERHINFIESNINQLLVSHHGVNLINWCTKLSEYIGYKDSKIVKLHTVEYKIKIMERKIGARQ